MGNVTTNAQQYGQVLLLKSTDPDINAADAPRDRYLVKGDAWSATYYLKLSHQSTHDVSISLTGGGALRLVNKETNELVGANSFITPSEIVFTPNDWDTPQEITLTFPAFDVSNTVPSRGVIIYDPGAFLGLLHHRMILMVF